MFLVCGLQKNTVSDWFPLLSESHLDWITAWNDSLAPGGSGNTWNNCPSVHLEESNVTIKQHRGWRKKNHPVEGHNSVICEKISQRWQQGCMTHSVILRTQHTPGGPYGMQLHIQRLVKQQKYGCCESIQEWSHTSRSLWGKQAAQSSSY